MANIENIVQHEIVASARVLDKPRQFWEQGWLGQIFGQTSQNNPVIEALTKRPRLEKLAPEGETEYVPASTSSKPVDYVRQRLVLARLIQTDDVVRHGALRKLCEIVIQDLDVTGLGRSLRDHSNKLSTESVLQTTFENVFTNKSTGTLAKRAGHLWELQMWCHEIGVDSIFHLGEADVYQFLSDLKMSGCGTSVGKQMLQAINFIFHLTDADKQQLSGLLTSRVKGVADSMMACKPQLKQAFSLTSDIVYGLEALMFRLEEPHHAIICGHLLFCIYSCARFGDTVFLSELQLNSAGDLWLVEAFSKKYKMGVSEKKSRFLPLVALGRGLFRGGPWARKWFEARAEMDMAGEVTMAAWSESKQCWLDRPMATGEAVTFLREFLSMCGFGESAYLYTCHSAKATILSWAAKANMMDFESRRLLGHHLAPAAASVLTYARDEMVRLQHTVHKILLTIVQGDFDPDMSRVDRLRQMVGNDSFPEELLPEREDETYEESDLEESDLDEEEIKYVQSCENTHQVFDAADHKKDFMIHSVSSIMHVVASDGKFLCGRAIGAKHIEYLVGCRSTHFHSVSSARIPDWIGFRYMRHHRQDGHQMQRLTLELNHVKTVMTHHWKAFLTVVNGQAWGKEIGTKFYEPAQRGQRRCLGRKKMLTAFSVKSAVQCQFLACSLVFATRSNLCTTNRVCANFSFFCLNLNSNFPNIWEMGGKLR